MSLGRNNPQKVYQGKVKITEMNSEEIKEFKDITPKYEGQLYDYFFHLSLKKMRLINFMNLNIMMILHKDSIGFSVNFHVKLSILTVRKLEKQSVINTIILVEKKKTITRKIIT